MRAVLFALMPALLLGACKGRKPVATVQPDPAMMRPEWVRSRPVSSLYYIGIGLAQKSRGDHQETAKKNALNDLASEISVTVEGNSLLYTLDQRSRFDESFTSTIRTRTNEQLEGFELVDTWENDSEYWTYYRLSRGEHARIKAERRQRAFQQATDLHSRSLGALDRGELRSAFDLDLRALIAIQEYWGEAEQVELDGKQVNLANELYASLQRLTSGTRITVLPERCELAFADGFRRELLIRAQHQQGDRVRDLVSLPLVITYPGASGRVTEKRSTDTDGLTRTVVQRVDLETTDREVLVRLDMEALTASELDRTLVRVLTAGLTVPERRVAIDLRMPRVFLQADERNFGAPLPAAHGFAVALKEELSRRGFRFTDRASDADMLLDLRADTREGGTASGFYTAFLDVTVAFRDRRTNEMIHQGGRQGIKGVQLTYEKAGQEAYKRGAQDLRRELASAIVNAIL